MIYIRIYIFYLIVFSDCGVRVMNVSLFNSLEDVKIPSSAHPNEMNDLDMQTH